MKLSGARILLATALVSGGLVALPAATAQAGTVNATLVKTTWTGGSNSKWATPSPDPSGITYNSRTGRLIISDGEVEETNLSWHVYKGTNLYVASLQGDLLETGANTLAYSAEPVGVGFRPALSADFPERLFISDDDKDRVFEVNRGGDGRYGTDDDSQTSFSTRFVGSKDDAEDVAVDLELTRNGQLLIIDGYHKEVYVYGPGPNKKFDGVDDTRTSFDVALHGAGDPEGIAFNQFRNTILVLDDPSNQIYEYNLQGQLQNIVKLPFTMRSGAGIALAPPSSGSGPYNAYIVDRGVDNDSSSTLFNDGRLYEITMPGLTGTPTSTNTPPTVAAGADQAVTLPSAANLDGTVTDSTPTGTLTSAWTESSGPGEVTFGNAAAVDTTASFSIEGTYVLRLTVDDGSATAFDELTVTVSPSSTDGGGGTTTLDIPVRASSDDAEQRSASVALGSGDLNLVTDGSTVQIVGMRFTAVNVPKGATITNAYVQFQVDEVSTGTASLSIAGQAADDPPTFAAVAGDLSATNRPRTTAVSAWAPSDWPTANARTEAQRTSNLASVVQEIVNRNGWASGNALALIVTGSGARVAESYDGGAAKAPVLHIEYRTS